MPRLSVVFTSLILTLSLSVAFAAEPEVTHGEYVPDLVGVHVRAHGARCHGQPTDFDSNEVVPVRMVEPEYPSTALMECRRGWVFVEFTITEEGGVDDIEVIAQDGSGLYEYATRRALRRWRFEPPTANGQPASRLATLPMIFERALDCVEQPPKAHEASLFGTLEIPVQAEEGIEYAEIAFMPTVSGLFGEFGPAHNYGVVWFRGDFLKPVIREITADLVYQLEERGDSETDEGLLMEPSDTRFARIVPIAERQNDGEAMLQVYFSDARDRNLVLLYVDQEASLSGRGQLGNTPFEYSLDFPGAGFYWAEFRERESDGIDEVVLVEPESPRLVMNNPQPQE